MSLPNWFYPIVMLWLILIPSRLPKTDPSVAGRGVWGMWLDTVFLLPWILNLAYDESIAAWIGVEIVGLVLLFDLLWHKPSEQLREAWAKLSLSSLLGWTFIGTAVALSGIHPIMENLFYPLPLMDIDRMRPVLAAVMFVLGLLLKLGLPPFSQGAIDIMELLDPENYPRWALQFRWGLAYSAWQLMPIMLGPLSPANRQLFACILLLGAIGAWLVAGVQASVHRTLAYMSSWLVLPVILAYLFMDPIQGVDPAVACGFWLFSIVGFISFSCVYQTCLDLTTSPAEVLLWSDPVSPCHRPGWFRSWASWIIWSVFASLGLMTYAFLHQFWFMAALSLLIILAILSSTLNQMGISSMKRQNFKI